MRIATIKETDANEPRVALTPETVTKLVAMGASVAVQAGAGLAAGIPDADYTSAGATVLPTAQEALKDADIVLKVRRPTASEAEYLKSGAILVGQLDPYGQEVALQALAKRHVTAFSLELLPRITRAQSMDILSSQANLAGYRAVIDASAAFGRALPMMMTAAGTVPAAKVFVMGAGVAGLQAIATARRMGAIVTATDVRPAVKEQVESLGAKFIAVEDDEFKAAETTAGYAKPMSAEYQTKQAELVSRHITKQDIIITTAQIPGRTAPRLVTRAMVESLAPGSIIVDLAVDRGGNCELSEAGRSIDHQGVTILGYLNVPGRLAATSSRLFARNLLNFTELLIDKTSKTVSVNLADELLKATCLTHEGVIVNPQFQPKAGAVSIESEKAAPSAKPSPNTSAPVKVAPAISAKPSAKILSSEKQPVKSLSSKKTAPKSELSDVTPPQPGLPKSRSTKA